VPTRLLDWTENPFIAFYFAVTGALFKVRRRRGQDASLTYSSDASIWILNPVAWNKHALRQQSYGGEVLTPGDAALHPYKPLTKFSDMYVDAVALYGAHNSPRIVAQRGVFTIFGQRTIPMEQSYEKEKFPQDCLLKVDLDRSVLPEMRASILNQGITESVVFPDLDGLAREMKREFKFEY
jgi:FRG domain